MTDNETNNMTLFNTLEQLSLVKTPEVAGQTPDKIELEMALASLWTRSDPGKPAKVDSRVIIKSPNGKILWSREYPVNLKKNVRHRIRIRIMSIGFDGFGRYRFIVQKKLPSGRWTKVASVPLEVLPADASAEKS
ncbi:MAG: hypothetical protein IH838_01010 [Proteobacteria bacterium]|nr:hypothetical protein [Pseudomonadota bacterium]